MTAAVCIEGLTKSFGSTRAVDGLSLVVEHGEIHGFLGPNGAGKSTTLRLLLGLLRRDAGSIRVLGSDPAKDATQIARRTSYVPGDVALWPSLTGREVLDALAYLRGRYDEQAEARLLEDFELDTRKRIRDYSKGNRQKVMLVAAFAARTALIVFDEPTSGLDPLMEQVFQSHVRGAAYDGRTVLLSSHVLGEVEQVCDTVTIIRAGRTVESGRLDQLRHLAAAKVTARLAPAAIELLLGDLVALGQAAERNGDLVELHVAGDRVVSVVAAIASRHPVSLTCEPASLEDLFLRHYQSAS